MQKNLGVRPQQGCHARTQRACVISGDTPSPFERLPDPAVREHTIEIPLHPEDLLGLLVLIQCEPQIQGTNCWCHLAGGVEKRWGTQTHS